MTLESDYWDQRSEISLTTSLLAAHRKVNAAFNDSTHYYVYTKHTDRKVSLQKCWAAFHYMILRLFNSKLRLLILIVRKHLGYKMLFLLVWTDLGHTAIWHSLIWNLFFQHYSRLTDWTSEDSNLTSTGCKQQFFLFFFFFCSVFLPLNWVPIEFLLCPSYISVSDGFTGSYFEILNVYISSQFASWDNLNIGIKNEVSLESCNPLAPN